MNPDIHHPLPKAYTAIDAATKASGFTMASDIQTCSLLKTLAASKPGGKFLELGTGTGLSTAWILDGMDKDSTLVSIDNEAEFLAIAREHLGGDPRLTLTLTDGGTWVETNRTQKYDYIFADTWHGKYLMLDEVLEMLNKGGYYIIDDMLPQPNWPEGHDLKAIKLIEDLEQRTDLVLTKQVWATGIVIAVKV
ncbi:class I SAM-dependent methyltransferase [Dyadobacter chenwenxiniae]|uniref:Class I SAM-dependent methyltransferase n=1 Tax=Dyadobacter chenwenxiniae TaxID=2906456 RepID=A0A9X1TE95_9BACT|nr:class I SAM-dependent methyltransferase [Dyadobacter chenwenxiniae]MCF0061842.1 class I SAM-dependent methyltransferase [Dyadobacter chenwenxiniae]UON81657.1 class I SAM-dependent methyltransferase [Dyadobacter chenwenxiniae]